MIETKQGAKWVVDSTINNLGTSNQELKSNIIKNIELELPQNEQPHINPNIDNKFLKHVDNRLKELGF